MRRSLAAALAVLIGALLSAPMSWSPATSVEGDPRIELSGRLLDGAGSPIASQGVTLHALIPTAEGADAIDFAEAFTDDSGVFSIVTTYPADTLLMDFELIATSATLPAVIQDVPGRVTEDGTAWELSTLRTGFDATVAVPTMDLVNDAVYTVEDAAGSATGDSLTNTDPSLLIEDPAELAEDTSTAAASATPEGCGTFEHEVWKWLADSRLRNVPNKMFQTRNHAGFRWTISQTLETQFGFTITRDGKWVSGGLSRSKVNTTGITASPTVPSGFHHKMWFMTWQYRKQRLYCASDNQIGVERAMNSYKWLPFQWHNNSGPMLDTNDTFKCINDQSHTGTYGAQIELSRETAVRYKGYFAIAGVGLDAVQEDRSAQKFEILPDSLENAKVCGSDKGPMYAKSVKEIAS